MVVTELAETSVAYFLGELLGMSVIPIAGAILLVVGLRQRSRGQQPPPSYPPPDPYLPGPPPTPPPYYPPPRPARSSTALIVVGLLLIAGGLLGITRRAIDELGAHKLITAQSPGVGQCVGAYNFKEHNHSPRAQDCALPDSIFEVVTKGSSTSTCPDGKSEDSDYAFLQDGNYTLCFVLNFVQGRCYTASGDAHGPLFAATDCDSSVPRFKVVKRADDSSDEDLCPAGTKPISYKIPARLYCLQPIRK